MDDVSAYNRERWAALVQARALFTRPWLELDPASALERVDPWGELGDVRGKDVLCLASGGGQQSAAFALAGARVTVLDLAEGQLARDRETAVHYGYEVTTVLGDMRDLSALSSAGFDIVFQPYSINFVPDCRAVFAEVARVLRSGGTYALQATNPFAAGLGTSAWNGRAFEVREPYVQGAEIEYDDEDWVVPNPSNRGSVGRPREYRQILSTLVNGLVANGFAIERVEEDIGEVTEETVPGSWDHFTAILPPWIFIWARLGR
jgi:ubiquinone/menaquinone biosynthesis C-methylase UbiE